MIVSDKQEILEFIIQEKRIQTNEELKSEIREFKFVQEEIEKIQAEIQDRLDIIKSLSSENKTRFSAVQKFMDRFSLDLVKADQWVAKLEEVLKYKVVRPDYKELWEQAISKVNKQTQKVLNDLKEAQLELKRVEKTKKLTIEITVLDLVNIFYKKILKVIKSTNTFNKLVKTLPKI